MNLDYLQEYIVLTDYMNFSKAASAQFISQPTLSRHIASLEKELGCELIDRNQMMQLSLTPAGQILKDGLLEIKPLFEKMIREIDLCAGSVNYSLHFGLPAVAIHDYLGNVPARLKERYPDLTISFFSGPPEECIEQLLFNQLDCILVGHYPFNDSDKLIFRDVICEKYYIIVNTSHALASKESVTFEDLENLDFLSVKSNYNYLVYQHVSEVMTKSGRTMKTPLPLPQIETVLISVRQGFGATLVGEHQKVLATGNLKALPIEEPELRRNIALCYKKACTNRIVSEFVDVFRKYGRTSI